MTAETDLLPCPFCGGSEHLLVEHLQGTIIHPAYRVRCDNCGACIEYTDKDCHAAWNARANLAELQREVEGLRAEAALLTHKVITCGVAADHPDANLTRTGAYASKWNSPQAERVRGLRSRAERLAGALRERRDWFEAQAKSISKGNGSSWDLMQVREQRDLCDAALDQETTNG